MNLTALRTWIGKHPGIVLSLVMASCAIVDGVGCAWLLHMVLQRPLSTSSTLLFWLFGLVHLLCWLLPMVVAFGLGLLMARAGVLRARTVVTALLAMPFLAMRGLVFTTTKIVFGIEQVVDPFWTMAMAMAWARWLMLICLGSAEGIAMIIFGWTIAALVARELIRKGKWEIITPVK